MQRSAATRGRADLIVVQAPEKRNIEPALDWQLTQAHAAVVFFSVEGLSYLARTAGTNGYLRGRSSIHDQRTYADDQLMQLGGPTRRDPNMALFYARMAIDGPPALFEHHIRNLPGGLDSDYTDRILPAARSRAAWITAQVVQLVQIDEGAKDLSLASQIRQGIGHPLVTDQLDAMRVAHRRITGERPPFSILGIFEAAAPGSGTPALAVAVDLLSEIALPKLETPGAAHGVEGL